MKQVTNYPKISQIYQVDLTCYTITPYRMIIEITLLENLYIKMELYLSHGI